MKPILTIFLLILECMSFGQSNLMDRTKSKIYIRAKPIGEKNELIGLQTRTDLADTIIENVKYRKFQTSVFTDYYDIQEIKTYFETFANNIYCLLDENKNVVHKINYQIEKEQIATIFGNQVNLSLEFINAQNVNENDSFIATQKTPRKYYQNNNSEIYLIIIPYLQSLVVSSNGQFYTKLLMGDNYNEITNGFQNNFSASTKFNIQKGDEIQLFYRRKWYNDTTNLAEYQDKQFSNFKYLGDTISNDKKMLKFEFEGYNFLSGNYDNPEEHLVTVTDSGYYANYQFIPFKKYNTELKIIDTKNGKNFFLQGVTIDTVDGYVYPKIVIATNGPYRSFILPFFPVPFIEFGNIQGIITYSKINGIEKGKKRERTYITDRHNIRNIISKSKNEVEISIYFIEDVQVDIKIQDANNEKIIGRLKAKAKKGLNTFIVRSKRYKKDEDYQVNIDFYSKNSWNGNFGNYVKAKY